MVLADRYRLDRLLGQGGMGQVWAAWDLRLARPVAVKLLAVGAADEAVARFRREARTEAHLHHPHIVEVYDFGAQGGRSYLVMQLVGGRTLADELRSRGPRPTRWVAEKAAQIADGLAEAHRLGIVHRDIKPSNILLDETGSVKIADFGIARSLDGDTATQVTRAGTVTGTSAYMPPEAARGDVLSPAADIYSLGCTLHQLLAGRPPFVAEHPLGLLHQHVECLPPPLRAVRPGVSEALEAFVLRMLAKDPQARPTAVEVRDWFAGGSWQAAAYAASAAPASSGARSGTRDFAPAGPVPDRPHSRLPAAAGAPAAVAAVAAAVFALAWPVADGSSPPPSAGARSAPTAASQHAAPGPRTAPARSSYVPERDSVPVSDRRTPASAPRGPATTAGGGRTPTTAPPANGRQPARGASPSTSGTPVGPPTTTAWTTQAPSSPPSSAQSAPTPTTNPPTTPDTGGHGEPTEQEPPPHH